MSWLMAAVYDRFMRGSEEACLARWRAELLRDLSGAVLEIGAGTGVTLPHFEHATQFWKRRPALVRLGGGADDAG